jgi:hypothetical protein
MKKQKYEPPLAIRLNNSDRAFGACTEGSTPAGYRVNGFEGVCVTGKSASDGCHAGASGSA